MDDMISVDGKIFKCPASFKWKKSDISASDAGRTDDTLMHKNKVGEKRTLSLGWVCLTKAEIHEILVAFEPECQYYILGSIRRKGHDAAVLYRRYGS